MNERPQMQLPSGYWMEAIPLAYRSGFRWQTHRCGECSRTFRRDEDYCAHYVYAHILNLADTVKAGSDHE